MKLPGAARGIRARLLLLCAIAVLPVVALSGWETIQVRRDGHDDAITSTVRLSRIASEQLSAALTEANTAMAAASLTGSFEDSTDVVSCAADLRPVRDLAPFVSVTFLAGPDGSIRCIDGHSMVKLDGSSYLTDASDTGRPGVGTEPSGVFDADPVVVAVHPVPGSGGLVLGAALELADSVSEFQDEFALEDGAVTLVVDDRGVVVTSSTDSGEGRRVPMTEIVDQVNSGGVDGTADARGFDGVDRTYSFSDVSASSGALFAVVGIPTQSTQTIIATELQSHVVFSMVMLIIAFAVALIMAEASITRPLAAIRDRLDRIGRGDLDARIHEKMRIRELAEVDEDIDDMARNLAERAESLRLASVERHRLLDELLRAQDEERRRIAADIHDDTIQSMIASGLAVQMLRHEVTDSSALRRMRTVEDRIGSAINRLRQLMFELEPVGVDGDLTAAVEQYLTSTVDESVELTVSCPDLLEPRGSNREVLLRNLRECVLNATRHGGAHRIEVEMTTVHDGVEVIVADDGSGMVPSALRKAGHHGMRVMRERVEALGGSFDVESEPGGGTTVIFWIPLESGERPVSPESDQSAVVELVPILTS